MGEKFLGEKCMDVKAHGRRTVYGGKIESKNYIVEESVGGKSGGEMYMVEQSVGEKYM